ncbi:MAG TPA: hypothetical protein VMV92_07115 [Streptosporangiaceae bacterium]|nr:hypothetical protein [Streptosporangiaceae bacterium]
MGCGRAGALDRALEDLSEGVRAALGDGPLPDEQLASPQELEGAEAAAALEEYREWSAAGRPGAISHEQARRLLLGEEG